LGTQAVGGQAVGEVTWGAGTGLNWSPLLTASLPPLAPTLGTLSLPGPAPLSLPGAALLSVGAAAASSSGDTVVDGGPEPSGGVLSSDVRSSDVRGGDVKNDVRNRGGNGVPGDGGVRKGSNDVRNDGHSKLDGPWGGGVAAIDFLNGSTGQRQQPLWPH